MMRFLLVGTAFLCALTVPALAEDQISADLITDGTGSDVSHTLSFAGACGEECGLASLTCDSNGSLQVILGDVPAREAAKSITRESRMLLLDVAGKTYELEVDQFSWDEMNVSWDVSARGSGSTGVYGSITGAQTFTLALEGRKEQLPVTSEVKEWTKLCAK